MVLLWFQPLNNDVYPGNRPDCLTSLLGRRPGVAHNRASFGTLTDCSRRNQHRSSPQVPILSVAAGVSCGKLHTQAWPRRCPARCPNSRNDAQSHRFITRCPEMSRVVPSCHLLCLINLAYSIIAEAKAELRAPQRTAKAVATSPDFEWLARAKSQLIEADKQSNHQFIHCGFKRHRSQGWGPLPGAAFLEEQQNPRPDA
jgi:hypothetical protein